ncbi:MAG TPA: hydroxymethylglutaryl-CoA lyase [Anaerolineales bacterium]|nr:hydroxymethylglutaryl-CoA lyase [Anaerolineales bacterium]
MSISSSQFKAALAQFASGVTVVTTRNGEQPLGVTVSSFTSVSLQPPLIAINLANHLFTGTAIRESGYFAVNILSTQQKDVGMVFAGFGGNQDDRFAGLSVTTATTNAPLLSTALAWLDCRLWAVYDGGDHTIFVGEVLDASVQTGEPVLYFARDWQRIIPLAGPALPATAEMVEVGLRDGIQTMEKMVPTAVKLQWVDGLVQAGVKNIQMGSFVNPKIVPQMADSAELMAALPRYDGVTFSALVLNEKGVERARSAGVTALDMGVAASETLNLRNVNATIAESMERMRNMVGMARQAGMSVRAGVQSAFGCVYEGEIPLERVVQLCREFLAMGIDELSIADSAGLGNPRQMRRTLQAIQPLAKAAGVPIVLHLHDTRGLGIANALAAIEEGVNRFDTAFGALGGCPFIQGAKGNIATEDTAHMLHEMGISTGIDIAKLSAVTRQVADFFGQELPGKVWTLYK